MTFHVVHAHNWMSVFMCVWDEMQVNRMNVYLQSCEIKQAG